MKYQVGETLIIRPWEEMVSEYGINENGNINCPGGIVFASSMRHLCSQEFTVKSVFSHEYRNVDVYHSEEGIENRYIITEYMMEPAFIKDVDIVEFENILAR